MKTLEEYFYYHVPGGKKSGFWYGLRSNYWRFVQWMPLLTILRPKFWYWAVKDFREGKCRTCQCGRTWWQYRLLPAIVGSTRFGGGC